MNEHTHYLFIIIFFIIVGIFNSYGNLYGVIILNLQLIERISHMLSMNLFCWVEECGAKGVVFLVICPIMEWSLFSSPLAFEILRG
jgi:hypothetical protein